MFLSLVLVPLLHPILRQCFLFLCLSQTLIRDEKLIYAALLKQYIFYVFLLKMLVIIVKDCKNATVKMC